MADLVERIRQVTGRLSEALKIVDEKERSVTLSAINSDFSNLESELAQERAGIAAQVRDILEADENFDEVFGFTASEELEVAAAQAVLDDNPQLAQRLRRWAHEFRQK